MHSRRSEPLRSVQRTHGDAPTRRQDSQARHRRQSWQFDVATQLTIQRSTAIATTTTTTTDNTSTRGIRASGGASEVAIGGTQPQRGQCPDGVPVTYVLHATQ